ncbi:MAG: hypothetical protein WD971_07195, partial [Pirellulales bacterium]
MSSSHELRPADHDGALSSERRYDVAHAAHRGEPHLPSVERPVPQFAGIVAESAAAGTAGMLEQTVQQLRAHASELADRLQSDRDALECRATELAAREGDLDANFRNAQLWLKDQRQELDQRARQFELQEAALAERETALEARADELTHVRAQSLAEQETRLREEQAELVRREAELAERLAALDCDRQSWAERRERLEEREATVEVRHRELDHRQGELYRAIEEFAAEKAGFGHRTHEIDRREQQVAQWEARLEAQVAALDAQTQSLRDRAGELE